MTARSSSIDRRGLLAAALLLCAGCGQPAEILGQLSGKVTFQGEPVTEGVVIFSNRDKGVHITANLDAGGAFKVEMARGYGLPLGTYEVSLSPPIDDLPIGATPPPEHKQYPNIPLSYRDPKTSGLSVTISPGENTLDIDMTP